MAVLKKTLLHTVGLLALAILAGILSGAVAGLAAGDATAAAAWCAGAYLALAVILPLGLWGLVITFWDQDRRPYDRWGATLIVTVVPAILGALAARFVFAGPATTAAFMFKPQLGARDLGVAMAAAFGWGQVLPVLIATMVGALLIAGWTTRRARFRH